jgi:type VI secretion system protein ImpG
MDDSLLEYYEKELTFIREMGAEFARKYPKIAGRLLLEADKCEDPHTERLIEAFAFISGRIHKKINDDFPEITESLLNILYPHYVSPIPSVSIAKFEPARKTLTASGYRIEKNTPLYSQPVDGTPCQFSTCYPVTLWPVEVVAVDLQDPQRLVKDAQQVIVVRLQSFNNLSLSDLGWKSLRFFLSGPYQHVYHLYELLLNNVCHVELALTDRQGAARLITLSPENIQAVGFQPDEGLFPYPRRSFPGYLLLFEYFCFPEKFLFFDLDGLDQLRHTDVGDSTEIRFYLNQTAKASLTINANTFCLHAAPAANLFRRIAEPIRVEHRRTEYHVIPDIRRLAATEILSIDRVSAMIPSLPGKEIEFRPFYSIKHHLDEEDHLGRSAFWHIQRRPSGRKGDDGTEVFLSFADLNFNPVDPDTEILTIHVTCTNRDLPSRLPFGNPAGDFNMEMAAPIARINTLIKPAPTRRPTLGGALQWHLISHLALNYMSLAHGGEEALREILKLYDFENSAATRQQINGIVSLQSEYVTKRIGQSFCRGLQVTIEFDEDKFVGAGLYLFASVLERFLGQYVSVNSFTQLVTKTLQRKEPLKKWLPRNGNRILL